MLVRRLSWLAWLALAGCFPPGYGNPPTDGGTFGFGKPTLQLTVGSARFGPAAPDSGSGVDLIDEVSPAGRTVRSLLTISASSTAAGGACQIQAERFGDGITGFFATTYLIKTASGATTADGTASPGAGELVSITGNSFRCVGNGCDGAVLSLAVLTADHAEGYLSGTFDADSGGGSTGVVCSFYVPTRTFRR